MSKRHERFTTPFDDFLAQSDNYRLGVKRAAERDRERDERINERFESLVAYGKASDVEAKNAANERSAARLAKYPPTETWVRFTVVPKGSEPIRVNPSHITIVGIVCPMSRRLARAERRWQRKMGVPDAEINRDFSAAHRQAMANFDASFPDPGIIES